MTQCAFAFLKSLSRLSAIIGFAMTASACGEPLAQVVAPTAFPSDIMPAHLSSEIAERRDIATFPLLNGSVRAAFLETGSTVGMITGIYGGNASQSNPGRATATLGVQVRTTIGVASGVTGVRAETTGALTGEGAFTLSLSLSLPSQNGTIVAKVRGTSTISCSAEQRILVTMRGTGNAPRVGDIQVELQHEVGNTNCF